MKKAHRWMGLLPSSLARPERFELPTFWFVARHSIQLSYGRVFTGNSTGGERGIRTLEGLLTLTPLAGVRLRPLGHLSVMQRAAKDSDPAAPRKAPPPELAIFSSETGPSKGDGPEDHGNVP